MEEVFFSFVTHILPTLDGDNRIQFPIRDKKDISFLAIRLSNRYTKSFTKIYLYVPSQYHFQKNVACAFIEDYLSIIKIQYPFTFDYLSYNVLLLNYLELTWVNLCTFIFLTLRKIKCKTIIISRCSNYEIINPEYIQYDLF